MSRSMNGSCRFLLPVALAVVGACGGGESTGNQPPEVSGPMVVTDEDVAVEIRALDHASDPDGDPLTVSEASAPGHTVELLAGGILRLTPQRDFHGMIAVAYKVSDGTHRVTGLAIATVRPVNDAPVAVESTRSIHRTTVIALEGRDADGDTLRFEIVTAPAHGALAGDPPTLRYTPDLGFVGDDAFSFRALDGTAASEAATVQLQIAADTAPTAVVESVEGTEDLALTVTLRGSDADGDPLAFTIDTPPLHGTLSGDAPNLTYTPEPDFNGTDSLVFSVSDGALSSSATIAIAVAPVNDAPRARPQLVDATEDTSLAITLEGSDVDGDALTFQVSAAPSHGTLAVAGATATYTPALNYHGPDSFTFRSFDGRTNSVFATVTIDVASVNDAPVGAALSRTLAEDTTTAAVLVGNDVEGDVVSFAVAAGPAHGTLTGTPPALTYVPDANYNGPDSFTYTVSDAGATSAPATVTLQVTPVNDLPVATSSAVTTLEDTPVVIALQGSDVDGTQPGFFIITPPADGTLTGTGANRTYTPAANLDGPRSFTFQTCDALGCSPSATVSIAITPVNDAPRAVDDFVATDPGTPLTFSVTGNDSDVDGDAVTLDAVGEPAHGIADIVDGQLVYTPDEDFTGTDVFSYTVIDAQGTPATAQAHVGVGAFPPGAPSEVVAATGPISFFTVRVPAISSDGRYIAFMSSAPLVDADSNSTDDIYLFNRTTRQLSRVSVATGGGQANGPSTRPHLSGNGRYVVFESIATNLVPGDTNGVSDVFRHDRVTGATVRISVATGGGQGTGASVDPEISEDGNLVAFSSGAFELVPNDANGAADVLVRDVTAGTTTRISVSTAGGEADLGSTDPAISGDGRFVAFASAATNLVAGDGNELSDVFVRDRVAGTTVRISVSSTGGEANSVSNRPSMSRDGRFVSFVSEANNLVPEATSFAARPYVRDVEASTTTLGPGAFVISARLSGDGRYMAAAQSNGVLLRDRFAAITVAPPGSSSWQAPSFSGNGRYVVVHDTSSGGRVRVLPNPL